MDGDRGKGTRKSGGGEAGSVRQLGKEGARSRFPKVPGAGQK